MLRATRKRATVFAARIGLAAVALACSLPAPAAAQTPPPPAPPPPATARPAIARVVEALAQALARTPARGLVVAAPLTSDAAAPRAAQLTATIAAQLAGRRGPGMRARPEPMPLAAAREAARADGALIHLAVEIASGKLRVTADLYPVPRGMWARIRDPEPGPVAHAFAEAPLDAEVRTFLAPIPIVTAVNVDRAKNFESDVVALACGDLDQDGAPEIVAVSRRRVTAERLKGGRVLPIVSRNWPDLAPVAPAPLREPIGFATILTPAAGRAVVDVGLTDRARSVRLDGELRVVASLGGLAVPDGDASACTRLGGLVVTGPLGPCAPGDPAPRTGSIGGQYDAFASAHLVSPQGQSYAVWAGRERGALELRDDAGHRAGIDSVGAQIAIGDLDQDGDPEIITSVDTLVPGDDAVVVRTWARREPIPAGQGPAARIREIARIPAAAGVRALAVCPPDGPGRTALVVATADEMWVVR